MRGLAALCVLLATGACLPARKPVDTSTAATVPETLPEGREACLPSPFAGRREPNDELAAPAPTPDSLADISARDAYSLLAINPQVHPYKVRVPESCVPRYSSYVAAIRICVSAEGTVSNVEILRPSIVVVDEQIPIVLGRWRFHPYVHGGQPMPFCFAMNYRVK